MIVCYIRGLLYSLGAKQVQIYNTKTKEMTSLKTPLNSTLEKLRSAYIILERQGRETLTTWPKQYIKQTASKFRKSRIDRSWILRQYNLQNQRITWIANK